MPDPPQADLVLPRGASVAGDAALPRVLLLGPARTAVSGVSTHLNQLFDSPLAQHFRLSQFQVGSEGRGEGRAAFLLRLITSPCALLARLVRVRPRIVHINTSFEPKGYWRDLVYLGVAKLLRLKVVYQIHGGALPAQFFGKSPLLTRLLRRVLAWPDAVVLLSAAELAAFREFAPAARLRRIANAVPIGEVDLSPARYAVQRPLAVTYLGRLAVDKGIFETIEAVRLLRERGVEVHLRIAGSGAALEQIRRAIAEADVGERVVLVGALFGAAKEQLWRGSDVLAFPSYREGLPYALLEAMSWGAVPVVTPVGAIAEVVQDQVHGLIVPPRNPAAVADALQKLSEDRALLHRLALAARERVASQFSVTRLVAEFNDLYRSLA